MLGLLLFILFAAPVILWLVVGRQTRHLRVIDLGVTFAAIVSLYSFLPLLGLWLADLGIGSMDSLRTLHLPPEETISEAGWLYAAFLLGFCVFYGMVRKQKSAVLLWTPSKRDMRRVLFFWIALKVTLLLAYQLLGARQAENYADSYLVLTDQPLIVQQLMGALYPIQFGLTVLLIVTAIAYRPNLRVHVGLLVLLNVGLTFVEGGSRTVAFLAGFAYVVALTLYGGLSGRAKLGFAVAGLLAFSISGALRAGHIEDGYLALLQNGEFVHLFFNSVDLIERGARPEDMGIAGFYFVDLLRVIPQQIVEWKVNPSAAYVQTYYPDYASAGGGLAFGAIAEAAIGYGWAEALVRGALLGLAFAWVANACLRQPTGMRIFIYVWFVVMSYQSVRDTTFSVFARYVFQIVPVLILLKFSGTFEYAKRRRTHTVAAT